MLHVHVYNEIAFRHKTYSVSETKKLKIERKLDPKLRLGWSLWVE